MHFACATTNTVVVSRRNRHIVGVVVAVLMTIGQSDSGGFGGGGGSWWLSFGNAFMTPSFRHPPGQRPPRAAVAETQPQFAQQQQRSIRSIRLLHRSSASDNTDGGEISTVATTTTTTTTPKKTKEELQTEMSQCITILNSAATTKQIDADAVYQALVTLEQLARHCNKLVAVPTTPPTTDPPLYYSYAQEVRDNLSGAWQLVFTTGTTTTQERWMNGGTINYFPIKAVQTFNATTNEITNAIYFADTNFIVLQFRGTFDFVLQKCQVRFDFDSIQLLQTIQIPLKRGQAAELGAASGLGSASKNVVNVQQKNKQAFFNWISADATIATARGGGGGLALWKRI